VHVGGAGGVGLLHNLDLRVINAREVAGTRGLVLLGLEREGVRVDTRVRVTAVVVVRLHLVEVLPGLLLEPVLTVEDQLEGRQRTNGGGGTHGTLLNPRVGVDTVLENQRGAKHVGGDVAVGKVGGHGDGGNLGKTDVGSGIPHIVEGRARPRVGEAPDELLDRVVVRKAHLLGPGGGHGVHTSVLHLLDQVLVALLGEPAALLGIQVHVVTPHLEAGGGQVVPEHGAQGDVEADLVVLEGNQGQVETRVAVEEEDQGQVHLAAAKRRRGHLTVLHALRLVEVKLRVQAPPLLVVLVDPLATDGQLDIGNGTLRQPLGRRRAVIRNVSARPPRPSRGTSHR
jgi:hypothetical protein